MNKKQETIIKNYAHDYRDVALNQYVLKNVLEKLSEEILKEQRKEIIEIGDKMKKNTHKKIEKEFWYDPEDNQKGEFEKYGEYEEFFVFTKKMTNQAIKNYQTKIKSLK